MQLIRMFQNLNPFQILKNNKLNIIRKLIKS